MLSQCVCFSASTVYIFADKLYTCTVQWNLFNQDSRKWGHLNKLTPFPFLVTFLYNILSIPSNQDTSRTAPMVDTNILCIHAVSQAKVSIVSPPDPTHKWERSGDIQAFSWLCCVSRMHKTTYSTVCLMPYACRVVVT